MIRHAKQAGVTLLEVIMVVLIMVIVSGMISAFFPFPLKAYLDLQRRAEFSYTADVAIQRMTREVHGALSNSIRSTTALSNQCIEFIPVTGGGRYRNALTGAGTGDTLDFGAADSSFDVLSSQSLPSFASNTYFAVIYNLGIPGADAYEIATTNKSNRAQIATSATSTKITLTAPNVFPFESEGKRFVVIPNNTVVYSCANNQLLRSTRALTYATLAPLASCPTTGDVIANNITSCSFDYMSAAFSNLGQLTVRLSSTQEGETVQLYQEIYVNNAP